MTGNNPSHFPQVFLIACPASIPTPTPGPPTAGDDSYSTDVNRGILITRPGILANDTSPIVGATLVPNLVSPPSHAQSFFFGNDGGFSYNPSTDFSGADTFKYTVNDGNAESNVATVTITVAEPPTANNDSYSTRANTRLTISAPGVLGNDTSALPLTSVLVAVPTHGQLLFGNNGGFIYDPTSGFAGSDSFTYKANDGGADSNVATVTITVLPPPTANDDSYSTIEGTQVNISAPGVLANDVSPSGAPLSAFFLNGPANGALVLGLNGSFTYTPTIGFVGTDSFTYQANDGTASSNVAIVTLVITPIPTPTPLPTPPPPPLIPKIAFQHTRNGNAEIYIMDPDGSNQTNLTNDQALDESPAWSPDGTRIAFDTDRDGNAEIYVMFSDGSSQTRLTFDPAADRGPTWSPDGARIAFTSHRDGNKQIYVMNADGSNQTRLTNNATDDESPAWSPDGAKIAFTSNRDGNAEIYV
ncbi:MAG: Ig-like domain-containing protein, partial [Candidatus Binatia bacterium]